VQPLVNSKTAMHGTENEITKTILPSAPVSIFHLCSLPYRGVLGVEIAPGKAPAFCGKLKQPGTKATDFARFSWHSFA
jgi:hypothetical protein